MKPGDRVTEADLIRAKKKVGEALDNLTEARRLLRKREEELKAAQNEFTDIQAAIKYGGGTIK